MSVATRVTGINPVARGSTLLHATAKAAMSSVREGAVEFGIHVVELEGQTIEDGGNDEATHAVGGVGHDLQRPQRRHVDKRTDMVDIARQHVLLGAGTDASRGVWACDRHRLDGVEAGVTGDRGGAAEAHLDAVVSGRVVRCGEDGARHAKHTGGVVHHVGRAQPDVDDVDTVFERTVAERLGELLPFGTHVVTHDHRALALAGNEAGEGTTDRLGAIGGELVGHRATHVVGLEDGIEIGHRSGSVSGVTRGLRGSASSDLPIIGRPTSFGRAFAAICG